MNRLIVGYRLTVAIIALAGLLICSPSALAAGTGQISGRVTHGGGLIPLQSICVTAIPTAGSQTGDEVASTDGNGNYTISGLQPGSYVVKFDGCGQNYIAQYFDDQSSFASAKPIVVQAGVTTTYIDADLSPGAILSGRVTDATGAPVPGIGVLAEDGTLNNITNTDSSGDYTIAGLAAGSYTLNFSPLPGAGNYAMSYYPDVPDPGHAVVISVTPGETIASIDQQVLAPGSIAGTVVDPSGHPLAGVLVSAYIIQPDGSFWSSQLAQTTAADGTYLIPNLAAGRWIVQFSPGSEYPTLWPQSYDGEGTSATADPVVVSPGHVTLSIDAHLGTSFCDLKPGCPPVPVQTKVVQLLHASLKRGALVVQGAISNPDSISVTLRLVARRGRRRITLRRSTAISGGRFRIVWRLPRADRHLRSGKLTIEFSGDPSHVSAQAEIPVAIPHRKR